MATSEFKVEGFDEAVSFLKSLDEKTNRRLLAASLRKASVPLVKSAKSKAPVAERKMREFWGSRLTVEPGALKRSIGTILPKGKNEKLAEMFVGPKKLKSSLRKKRINQGKMEVNKNDGWFRHFVIRGTSGYTIKKGKNAGRYIPGQQANPFMDDAYNSAGGQVKTELKKSLTTAINSYIKRKGVKVK